ncbi:GntR family transcriptional regulator [Paracoccus contaminans]|uniref:GntR family transcriptional regulator n=1 Tax=Paracoccus contaminans TaxID=1945662 RepID=A0A1W6CZA0_9RHOB|nr:GntR family transcriptional regulator [Paracoccus contaminans]ARJ70109.1 GntR family transcriptional regulator [Paracoccus contaminans]
MPPATFKAIKADLLRRIQHGEWPPGGRLPDEVDLAGAYGVARTTVGRAMRELVADGLIERRRKAGTRVRAAPLRSARFQIPLVRDEITTLGAAYSYRLLASDIADPPAGVAAALRIGPAARLRHLLCLHFADGAPYQLEDRWINLAAAPDAAEADFSAQGPNEWLVSKIPFTSAEIGFSAVAASAAQSAHLACEPGTALFCIDRRTEWQRQPVTLVRLIYREGHRLTTRY